MTEFTADMCGKLKNYVYRLIDPRGCRSGMAIVSH